MIKQIKILAVALTAIGLVSTAFAGDMTVDGKAVVRAEQKTRGSAAQADYITSAFTVNMKWTPDPKVAVFFQPKFYKGMGDTSGGSQGASTSGGLADSALDVHQAYITLIATDKIAYSFGRYEMNYGDHLVLGGVPWHQVGRSFDGMKAHWTMSDSLWLDVFYNKITETTTISTNTGPTATADTNFYGLYFGAKPGGALAEADLYYLIRQVNTPTGTGEKTEDRNTMGLRVKGAAGAVDYRVEYTSQSGKDNTTFQATPGDITDANQTDAELGFKFGQHRLAVEYFTANKNYHQLYPTAHKWLGFGDWFGRRNINGVAVHLAMKFMDHMGFNIDYHTFSRTDDATGVYSLAGTAAYGLVAGETATTSKDIGSEIDVTLTCTKVKSWVWTAGYTMFSAGEYGKAYITGSPTPNATFGYVMATATF